MNTLTAVVKDIQPLTHFVYRIVLQPQQEVEFNAGQYLMLHLSEEDKRPFSIACHPGNGSLELHIGASSADDYAMQAIAHIQANKEVQISAPHGDAFLREDSQRPVLLLAGGTGFSYINSILQQLHAINYAQPVMLYWGVKTQADGYAAEALTQLADKWPNLQFSLVVEKPDGDWRGHQGLVHKAVMADIVSLESYDIYIAGRFDMVGVVRDDFVQHGADVKHIYGDALAFLK